jgi:outer membrane lipoprotein LolB
LKRRQFLRAGGAAAALLASACATLETSSGAADGEPLGPSPEAFVAIGRLALRQGERSDHLGFDWTHSAGHDRVLFLSPLGQGLAEIVRDGTGARLLRPDAEPVAESDLAALARRLFGTPLPLAELADWLRGARGYGGDVEGWRVEIASTAPSGQRRLPRRIDVRRDDVQLTLIVTEWGEPD